MSILGIDHYGIIVRDIKSHYENYMAHLFPGGYGEIIHDPLQEVDVSFIRVLGGALELVQPTNSSSPISRALQKQVSIYHHTCLLTNDIAVDLECCRENGQFVVSTPKPAVAFNNRKIAFVMGRDGLLWELLEDQ